MVRERLGVSRVKNLRVPRFVYSEPTSSELNIADYKSGAQLAKTIKTVVFDDSSSS